MSSLFSSSTGLRLIASGICALGENPLWHAERQCLYWCDITLGRLFEHCPSTGTTNLVHDTGGGPAGAIGGFTIEADGALLLFLGAGRIERWCDGNVEPILPGLPEMQETRFNDVIADPVGRVFCGTMSTGKAKGKLYRLDTNREIQPVVENVGCSNGLAFSRDGRHLYYTDSTARIIHRFDYDVATGEISNQQPFIHFTGGEALPDGMTIDAEGHIWSAQWDGGAVIRYAPSGHEISRILVPTPKVTSLTFGGEGLRTLFITTAGGNEQSDEFAGSVFAVEPGVRGVPEFLSRIGNKL